MRKKEIKSNTKIKTHNSIEIAQPTNLNPNAPPSPNPIPQICLVDMEPNVQRILEEKLYSCTNATLGPYIEVPKQSKGSEDLLNPLVSLPSNLHEYEVAVVDLSSDIRVKLNDASVNLKNLSEQRTYALVSSYPQQIFNSKAFGAYKFRHDVSKMLAKESALIVFAAKNEQVDYKIAEIGSNGWYIAENTTYESLRICEEIADSSNKLGKKIRLPAEPTKFDSLLEKYLPNAEYEVIFHHPNTWYNGRQVPDPRFIPLLQNEANEVVGYAYYLRHGSLVIVLPQITKKPEFLIELFDLLAETLPKVFPYNGLFSWINDGSYPLPGEHELREQRIKIEEKYKTDIEANEASAAEIKHKFKFLHDMLSESGEALVLAVTNYLHWLEFPSIKNMDEHVEGVLEEDIQIKLEKGILIAEVKGIGGTSKDKECSQISKIKNRRMEERQSFDVSALYIVNHQRYRSPKSRTNPPFTEHQDKDAIYDKRGLVTTYELYKAYFDITRGLLTKEQVRNQLLEFGIIELSPPNLIEIGVATEIFKNGTIAILELSGQRLTKGMSLFTKKNGIFSHQKITELQVNNTQVDIADKGEVGVQINGKIQKGTTFYIEETTSEPQTESTTIK